MIAGIISVLSLAVVATIIYNVERQGSQGPQVVSTIVNGGDQFFKTLMDG